MSEPWEPIDQLALRYRDVEIAPGLRASGMPEDALTYMRNKYPQEVAENPEAKRQLREWAI